MLPATIEWKDGRLLLLDQRQLPSRTEYVSCESAEETARAIENMTVRGAPAIGVAAAYGLVLALKGEDFAAAARRLAGTRPTAVNLFWAIRRMEALWRANEDKNKDELYLIMEKEAKNIHDEDIEINKSIGRFGQEIR